MSVIVLATSGRDVLITQGGKWLVDSAPDNDAVYSAQKITGFPNTEVGRQAAVNEAIRRSKQFGEDVRFTPLEWKTNPDRYSTRFLIPINPPGFIKGTYPDKKFPGETPEKAARREFKEESGYSLDRFKLTEKAPGIFYVEIPTDQKDVIRKTWREMGPQNELYELRWEPIPDIRTDILKLNPQSQPAVQYLPMKAGTRRRRRRKAFRSRKQKR